MESSSMLMMVLANFVQSLPNLIVHVVGLALSLANLGRKPKTAKAGLIAFSVLIVLGLAGVAMSFLAARAYSSTEGIARWAMVQSAASFVFSLLGAACMGVIVYGMFAADKPEGKDAPSA